MLPPDGRHENVEVRGSHLGLGHNPAVAMVVADRLAQRAERVAPVQRAALGAALAAGRLITTPTPAAAAGAERR